MAAPPGTTGREAHSPSGLLIRSIPQLLADAADQHADRTWLRTDDLSLTFADTADRVGAAARRFAGAGIGPGDLVVVTARTSPPYLLTWLALAAARAITVPTNPAGTAAELRGLLDQAQPRAVVSDAGLRALLADVGVPDESVLDVAEVTASGSEPLPTGAREDDVAVLIPTSGTTGRSKLVMQTHRAYVMAGEGFPFWMELTRDDVLMTSLPLFHINAPAYSAMGSLSCGAGLVLLPRFSASTFIDSARHFGATEFNAIGAMLEILMRQPERPDDADNPLRLCYTGPSPTKERQEQVERRFGLRIVCGYAMSESPYGLVWPHGSRPFGTLGKPRQHPTLGTVNEVRVVDEAAVDVPVGATGELLLRNPVVTPGYWNMPEETARTIVDGWLHTGDLVTKNADGTYTFVSRVKEVLRRRGENVAPAEIEDVLLGHPDVADCAVIGVPSELTEEEIKAFVVPLPGQPPNFAALHAYLAERLTAFKVPRFWQAIHEVPRTPTARVARHRLPAGRSPDEWDAATASTPGGL